ncbi:MAG: alpha/beta fold hydrolase [Caulobacter sp.]|nr:alpha/beta fold hydrolase [Caulobacter sp.]
MRFASILAAVALLTGLVAPDALAQGAPPTIAELTAEGRIHGVEVSPSGRYLAIIRHAGVTDTVQIIDLVSRTQSVVTGPPFAVFMIGAVHWKSDDRLIYSYSGFGVPKTSSPDAPKMRPRFAFDRGLMAVNRDGSRRARIVANRVIDWLDRDPGHVLIQGVNAETLGRWTKALKVDVETGKVVEMLDAGDATTLGWDADREGNVVVRYERIGMSGGMRVLGRGADKRWQELFTVREKDVRAMPDLEVLRVSPDPSKFYVAVKPEPGAASDTRELRLYDLVGRTMGPLLLSLPRYDFEAVTFDEETGEASGLCFWDDVFRCDLKDPAARKDYEAMVARFGSDRSVFLRSKSRSGDVQVIYVQGPTDSGSYHVYDRRTGKVEALGNQRPALKDRLAPTVRTEWTTRDGVTLSGYLTTPRVAPAGKAPLVLMPHGGPEARDKLDYDRWAQAFAARGYTVFQPNFRGSGGFGAAFAAQGYGQWGLRMQDDIMDGVQALIDQGKVDADRMCVVGGSYGGYVGLYAGAKTPERFKCVVSLAGVGDLVAMQKWQRARSGADSPTYRYWLKSIGDPDKDRDRLVATSPITYAGAYGPPVLLIHGTEDDIVPISQSRDMNAALKRAGRSVTFIEVEGEGHSGWDADEEAKALTEMVAFVDAAIGRK